MLCCRGSAVALARIPAEGAVRAHCGTRAVGLPPVHNYRHMLHDTYSPLQMYPVKAAFHWSSQHTTLRSFVIAVYDAWTYSAVALVQSALHCNCSCNTVTVLRINLVLNCCYVNSLYSCFIIFQSHRKSHSLLFLAMSKLLISTAKNGEKKLATLSSHRCSLNVQNCF